ncbi:hypothetical protein JTB14_016645 [Gonioctena quinquepunctata]|nr:hypothetical protein JTB14_016645 [Gonioctena quinquepunctata]
MQQYDFKIIHREGEDHVVPVALSRSVPVTDSISGQRQTEKEEVQDKWYLRVRDKVVQNPKKKPSWRYGLGKLYEHVKPAFSELGETTDAWKLVVSKEQRKGVLTEVHERAIDCSSIHEDFPTVGVVACISTGGYGWDRSDRNPLDHSLPQAHGHHIYLALLAWKTLLLPGKEGVARKLFSNGSPQRKTVCPGPQRGIWLPGNAPWKPSPGS